VIAFADPAEIDLCDVSDLLQAVGDAWAPDEDLLVHEWAEQRRTLSRKESPGCPGPWRNSRAPYAVEIQECLSPDHPARTVVWWASSQVAKTEVGNNFVGWAMDVAPASMLVVRPSESDARKWSRQRLRPMIQSTATLREKVASGGGREGGNSLFLVEFLGGILFVGWAGSATELASMPIAYLFLDEVDKYKRDVDGQGDAIAQAKQRTQNVRRAKIFIASTGTNEGESRIAQEYESGDKRRRWVPCPDCGEFQVLKWKQVQWEQDVEEVEGGGTRVVRHYPETACYVCEHCGTCWNDAQRWAAEAKGEWRAEKPFRGIASFHCWAAYSHFVRLQDLAEEWLDAQGDHEKLKAFVNLKLGELWKEPSETLDPSDLRSRLAEYPAEVPAGVAVLTAAVDVQKNRLEAAVVGWGVGEEAWFITHQRLHGDPELPEVWAQLEAVLTRGYQHESGATLHIRHAFIDAQYKGPEAVYPFVRLREGRGVFAVRGMDSRAKEVFTQPKRRNKHGVRPVSLASWSLKDGILPRLQRQHPGPKYIHFCQPRSVVDGMDANFFEQFAAERVVQERNGHGRMERVYKQVAERNEAIDLTYMNYAAFLFLGPAYTENLPYWLEEVRKEGARARAAAGRPRPAVTAEQDEDPVEPAGFVMNW